MPSKPRSLKRRRQQQKKRRQSLKSQQKREQRLLQSFKQRLEKDRLRGSRVVIEPKGYHLSVVSTLDHAPEQ